MQLPFPVKGEYERGKYSRCRWCDGRGCLGCDGEAMKDSLRNKAEYDRQFPNGPTCVSIPIERIGEAKDAIGANAIVKAFSEGGGGVKEVFDNLERLGFGKPTPIGKED